MLSESNREMCITYRYKEIETKKATRLKFVKEMINLPVALEAIQKVCHQPRAEWASSKIVSKSDKGGRGSSQTVMSPLINFQEKFS